MSCERFERGAGGSFQIAPERKPDGNQTDGRRDHLEQGKVPEEDGKPPPRKYVFRKHGGEVIDEMDCHRGKDRPRAKRNQGQKHAHEKGVEHLREVHVHERKQRARDQTHRARLFRAQIRSDRPAEHEFLGDRGEHAEHEAEQHKPERIRRGGQVQAVVNADFVERPTEQLVEKARRKADRHAQHDADLKIPGPRLSQGKHARKRRAAPLSRKEQHAPRHDDRQKGLHEQKGGEVEFELNMERENQYGNQQLIQEIAGDRQRKDESRAGSSGRKIHGCSSLK